MSRTSKPGPGRQPHAQLDLEHFLPYRLSVLSNRISSAIAREYSQRFALSVTEWRVMAVLGHAPNLSAGEVARRTAMDKVAVSRAVARLNILADWALPYVKTGGYFISLKGAQYEDELAEGEKALQILGGKIAEVRPVHLPGLDDVRAVLYIEKVKESPKKYPRKPKMAAKNPL